MLRALPWMAGRRLIAFSGYGGDRDRAMAAGFDRHLTRPVDFTEVHRYVELARRC